ncbi:MAG: class I SAM-dependent methyltransferase [Flavobacteriales bacterium]|nr:class I SAM-dependent methyltransferase [Flavobacteriales bacterium]
MNTTANTVNSPLTGKAARKIQSFEAVSIVDHYSRDYGIDISRFFHEIKEISVYECTDTHYRFYYPFSLSADEKVYDQLQEFSWYYVQQKWDFGQALSYVKPGDSVLEVGCGNGNFLEKLVIAGAKGIGLELNRKAIDEARRKQLVIEQEVVEHFAQHTQEKFDVVCAFHLLEHIWNVKDFIDACIACLKPGGHLLFTVPNHDFMGQPYNPLDKPPHHMGLWGRKAFKGIEKAFPIRLTHVHYSHPKPEARPILVNELSRKLARLPPVLRSMSRFAGTCYPFVPKRYKADVIMAVFTRR